MKDNNAKSEESVFLNHGEGLHIKEMPPEKCYVKLHPKGQVNYKEVVVDEGEDEFEIRFGRLFGLTLYIPKEDIHYLADALSEFRTKPKSAEQKVELVKKIHAEKYESIHLIELRDIAQDITQNGKRVVFVSKGGLLIEGYVQHIQKINLFLLADEAGSSYMNICNTCWCLKSDFVAGMFKGGGGL